MGGYLTQPKATYVGYIERNGILNIRPYTSAINIPTNITRIHVSDNLSDIRRALQQDIMVNLPTATLTKIGEHYVLRWGLSKEGLPLAYTWMKDKSVATKQLSLITDALKVKLIVP